MDTLDIKELLSKAFGDAFVFHPKFYEEFVELVRGSGSERKILTQFLRRLDAIRDLDDLDFGLKWLERLKKCDNLYSLHIDADGKNYRMLFSRSDDGKYFLHVFYERSGKKNSSYAVHIQTAINRRNEK